MRVLSIVMILYCSLQLRKLYWRKNDDAMVCLIAFYLPFCQAQESSFLYTLKILRHYCKDKGMFVIKSNLFIGHRIKMSMNHASYYELHISRHFREATVPDDPLPPPSILPNWLQSISASRLLNNCYCSVLCRYVKRDTQYDCSQSETMKHGLIPCFSKLVYLVTYGDSAQQRSKNNAHNSMT